MLSATNDSKKAGPARVVEDQGAGDLHLAHGQLPPVARGPVGVGERCGDGGHPPVEERFDVSQAEPVTDGLNGAFGVGKTQTAHELQRRLRVGHVADPELLGFATHKMLPEQARGDFQDLPEWRVGVVATLRRAEAAHDGPVIVPMTVVCDEYSIVGGLRSEGIDLKHYALIASPETLRGRLRQRLAYVCATSPAAARPGPLHRSTAASRRSPQTTTPRTC